jgi:hypothetical protein
MVAFGAAMLTATGKPLPRTGAVAFVQRFDSALRLNVHLHGKRPTVTHAPDGICAST